MSTTFDEHERRQWAGQAVAYERSFARLCAFPAPALLAAAQVTAGSRVLDAGTGPGTVAAVASTLGACVTAIDAELTMVELTSRNVPSADVRHAALPELPFPDGSFDVAVANFVINHVGDPRAAVAELRRVVRPAGRIAVTIWPYPQGTLQALWGEAIAGAGVTHPDKVPRVEADLDFGRTEEGLAQLLTDAKLADVSCETLTWAHVADPEDWWSGPASGIGTVGQIVIRQSPETIARIKQEYERLSARYITADGLLALPTAALLATGSV